MSTPSWSGLLAARRRESILALRWIGWLTLLAVWTFALLTPYPVEVGAAVLPEEATFPTAKTLHVGMYALLCGLSAWLGLRGWLRWLPSLFLVLHGGATEFLQNYVPSRNGCWSDVGLDALGVGLGLVLIWLFRTARPEPIRPAAVVGNLVRRRTERVAEPERPA